jgi:hypothetical protein
MLCWEDEGRATADIVCSLSDVVSEAGGSTGASGPAPPISALVSFKSIWGRNPLLLFYLTHYLYR